MKYVLLIPGWFPSKVDRLTGDFIERHARAAALFFPVKVLFVTKDNTIPVGRTRVEYVKDGNYEALIYYYSSRHPLRLVERALSLVLQAKSFYAGFRKIAAASGLPSLIHAHVLVKHAWFALRQSRKYRIPLLASEQWTGYLPEARDEFARLGTLQKRNIRATLRAAVHVTAVSDYLARQMQTRFPFRSYSVVPNLVDTAVFTPRPKAGGGVTTFIHISTLSPQKNFGEVLEACKQLRRESDNWRLLVVAPPAHAFGEQVVESGLAEHIIFLEEVSQTELAPLIAGSDALLLYSRYETFGCVIVEANACGVPVIVSDHPVFEENVREGITGFHVPLHQPRILADRLLHIINKAHSFDKDAIVAATKQAYSFEIIGKQFAALYERYAKP